MEIIKYTAGPMAPFPESKANEIGEYLMVLYNQYGMLTPELLFQHAKDSVVEPYFTWNQADAAFKQHLQEARHIINRLNVVIRKEDGRTETRAFHQVHVIIQSHEEPDQLVSLNIYKPFRGILDSEEETQEVWEDVLKMLVRIRNKYAHYKELTPVFEAIDKVRIRIAQKKTAVEKALRKPEHA